MGSWTFRLKYAGNGYIVSDDEAMVCDVYMTNEPTIALNRAKLIAQAPVLYAVLKDMAEFWAYGLAKPGGSEPTAADQKRAEELGERAEAVLRAVEGQ